MGTLVESKVPDLAGIPLDDLADGSQDVILGRVLRDRPGPGVKFGSAI
jgi:hypothetical protein